MGLYRFLFCFRLVFVSLFCCCFFFPFQFFLLSGTYNRAAAENGSSDTAIVGRRDKLTPHTSSFVSEMPRVLLRNHLFFLVRHRFRALYPVIQRLARQRETIVTAEVSLVEQAFDRFDCSIVLISHIVG